MSADQLLIEEQKRQERQKERFLRKSTQISSKYLRKVTELRGMPSSMNYFVNILRRIFIDNDDVEKDKQTKTIGTFCVMAPQELIYAAGAMPVKLCSGNYTAFNIGDEKAPRDACPLIKAVMGSKIINGIDVYDNCSSYIVPTSCDCKKKMGYLLSEYKDVHMLHVPTSKKDDESINYYLQDLYELKEKLEKITGNKITYDNLCDAVYMISEVQYEISRFYKLKMHKPALIRGTHAMAIMNSYSYDNAERWGKALKLVNDELELKLERKEFVARENSPRIMITGSPIVFPNIKLPLLIEEMGGVLVADETCMGDRGIYDPVSVVDDSFDGMMRALANRYILPCTCPTFVKNKQRLFKIKQMIKDYKVEGVIYHVLRGCLVYDYEYTIIEEMLNEMGIPVIRVETDYNEEDIEQLRIRIEAFNEMIKFKKD
ncbi:MAG: 2-hydroxyacyl-CoA dehydratase family protein, partial [Intestinibacter bartlettii]|uniref:2-hydroxyacyl-CoA dehydratase family protein n=1 Tax=Intestinibacter bartlettii TaxID=261299 RepID=UPI0026EE979E